ncbi:hypothetical protein CEXT_573321 [Caerostris extrusa]|uniref:Uncharacterized protein n=1 Tax=Caerostris extrusa TaxID=172846 RepID=A0AAV4RE12_CAEEX|nr:hypothetical protein CEXT_573321 [Caerostris extrusa]
MVSYGQWRKERNVVVSQRTTTHKVIITRTKRKKNYRLERRQLSLTSVWSTHGSKSRDFCLPRYHSTSVRPSSTRAVQFAEKEEYKHESFFGVDFCPPILVVLQKEQI